MARLYVRQDGQEQMFEIEGDLVSFGRSSENTIQIRDIKSSRRHCQIENTPAGFKLVDLESANGTSVNGVKVNHCMLQPGDVVAIGAVEIHFGERPPALEAPPAVPAATDSGSVADPEERKSTSVQPAQAPAAAPAGRPQRLAEVRGRTSTNPWIIRTLVGAAAAVILVAVGLVAKNAHRDYQLQQAAEQDYVRVLEAIKSGTDADRLAKIQSYVAAYPNSPRAASLQDKATALQATISRMETAQADLKTLKARAAELSGDLESLREEFRALLARNQDGPLAERIKAEVKALDTRIARHGQERFEALESQANEFVAVKQWGAAADVYKMFIAAHPDDEVAVKANEKLATVLRAAFEDFDALVARSNGMLEKGSYADAANLFHTHIARFSGTLPYYQAQLKLLGIDMLARGDSQAKEDQKLRAVREECFQLAVKADDLAKIRRYSQARKQYDEILAKLTAPELGGLREVFAARAKDVLAESQIFARLIETINAKKLAPNSYALSAEFTGTIEHADEQVIDVRFPRGFTRVAWLSLKPREILDFYKRLAPKGDDLYTVAVFCYQHHMDDDAARLLNDLVQADPGRKPTTDQCVARARGIDVPEGGFIYHRDAWMTPDEHKYALLDDQVDVIVARIGRPDDKDMEKGFTEYQALANNAELRRDFRDSAREKVAAAFDDKRTAALKKLAKLPSIMKRDHLKTLRDELNKRRKAALELIFNEQVYTYDSAKNDHGEKAQPDVNKLVDAVKELWERPMDIVVRLDKSVQKLIEDVKDVDKYIAQLGGTEKATADSDYADMLTSINKEIDIRSIALDSGERQVLEHNRRVWAFNGAVESGMNQEEMRQIEITNQYREMMGRKILEAHKLLGQSARKHSEWMVNSGVFSHDEDQPDRRTPGDRMAKEGYSGPGGENICMGAGDPRTAFEMWYNSSGHHRNMLTDAWNQMGVGRSGMHWTQNFGNSAPLSNKTSAEGGDGKGGDSGAGGTGGNGGNSGTGGTTGGNTPGNSGAKTGGGTGGSTGGGTGGATGGG